MSNSKTLSWNDRLALMEHFNPSDEEACEVFGVSKAQLETARNMPQFTPTPNLDFGSYENMFPSNSPSVGSGTSPAPANTGSVTSTVKTSAGKLVTATKTQKQPKKRGRRGDKIAKAFAAIPETPTPVAEFANQHNVSVAVLRQGKRFNPAPEMGVVRVKKDKGGELVIWREPTAD